MKTEKRLTMALSVLVALMMLAVPFASIVDTSNENGENSLDAPVLGAYGDKSGLIIKLDIPTTSGDVPDYEVLMADLKANANNITDGSAYDYIVSFSYDSASNSIFIEFTDALTGGSAEITAYDALVGTGTDPDFVESKIKDCIEGSRVGYTLEWAASETILKSIKIGANSDTRTVGAVWTLKDDFAEANVTLTMTDYFENETVLTYTKAVPIKSGNYDMDSINDLLPPELVGLGKEIVLTDTPALQYVYSRTISVANASTILGTTTVSADDAGALTNASRINVAVENNNVANNIFTLTYEPMIAGNPDGSTYPYLFIPLIITSEIFDEDVILYIPTTDSNAIPSYVDLIDALLVGEYLVGITDAAGKVYGAEGFNGLNTPITSNDGSYKLTRWDYVADEGRLIPFSLFDKVSNVNLTDRESITVILVAEKVSYPVLFFIGSEYQLVNVPYGELSEDSCTLDKTGVTSWARYDYVAKELSIPVDDLDDPELEEILKTSKLTEPLTFIGLKSFEYTDMALVTFFAEGYNKIPALTSEGETTPAAYFEIYENGDQELIIDHIPVAVEKGTTANNIQIPLADPLVLLGDDDYSEFKFMFWNAAKLSVFTGDDELPSKPTNEPYAEYTFPSTDIVNEDWDLTAVYCLYDFVIELYVNNSLYATLYCEDIFIGDEMFGILYPGSILMVEFADGDVTFNEHGDDEQKAFRESLAKALIPAAPAGYSYEYWADSEGNEVFKAGTVLPALGDYDEVLGSVLISFAEDFNNVNEDGQKCINEDTALYAYFEAKSFVVFYISNYGGASFSTLYQIGTVDDELVLFGNQAFPNAALSLKSWVTQLNGQGDEYDLLANVTIDGETYESLILDNALDLKTVYGLDGTVIDAVLKTLGIIDLNSTGSSITDLVDITEAGSLLDLDLSALILYANWEDVAAGEPGTSEPGTSSENNNETSIETYLLAVILILIILALIIIVVMMRNKQ